MLSGVLNGVNGCVVGKRWLLLMEFEQMETWSKKPILPILPKKQLCQLCELS
jgi:hypothetical protein